MLVKLYKSLIMNAQHLAKRLQRGKSCTEIGSETYLVSQFFFFNQRSRVLQIQMVFLYQK